MKADLQQPTAAASPSTADAPTPQAWSARLVRLYRSNYSTLTNLAQRIVCDRALAEDCVQEAFMAFHTKQVQTKPGAEAAYLRSMVRNGAISLVRKEARGNEFVESQSPRPTRSAEDSALANIGSAQLVRGVEQLSHRQSEVIGLSLVGMSVGETAETLRISSGTVKTHRHRAVAALRVSLLSGIAV